MFILRCLVLSISENQIIVCRHLNWTWNTNLCQESPEFGYLIRGHLASSYLYIHVFKAKCIKKKITFNIFSLSCRWVEKLLESSQSLLKCTSNSKLIVKSQVFRLLYPVLSAYFYFHSYELGILFSCSFSYTSMLFLQAVLNLSFFCWNIYAHICHTLSYLPSFIAARSLSLVSLNFKVLSPNHLIKPVFKICPSAILAWSAWPLWTINYPSFINQVQASYLYLKTS